MASWDNGKPVPVIQKDSAVYRAGTAEYGKLANSIGTPAATDFMAARLYKLQGHYWQQGMSDALAREVAKDYIRLLDGYSESVWGEVCDAMLLDSERKFFPKVGEMKQSLDGELASRKWKLKKLQALLDTAA